MNQYEKRIFDHLLGCNGNEDHFNSISRGTNTDRTDTKNTLDSMLKKQIITKRPDGKFTIYKINHDYKDAVLMMLEIYESRIKNYEDEIIKSLKYLKNKKLFVRDLKFVNKPIKNNVEGIVRFTKAIIDISSTVGYIEVFMKLDSEHAKTVRDIQKTAYHTARKTTDRFFDEHTIDQPNLSTYLEFEIPILFTIA